MMRTLAWTLLLAGVVAGAAGAALNAGEHRLHRAEIGLATTLERAHQARGQARERLQSASAHDLEAAERALATAEAHIGALRESGTFSGELQAAAAAARAQARPVPPPAERFLGWLRAGGLPWGLGVVLIGAGAWLERRERAKATASASADQGSAADFLGAVDQAVALLADLDPTLDSLPLDGPSVEIRTRIDALQDEVLTPLVNARGQLIARHGLTTFAVYFGEFSAGERNLARVWSALTDGHTPTALEALHASRESFEQARRAYVEAEAALKVSSAPAPG